MIAPLPLWCAGASLVDAGLAAFEMPSVSSDWWRVATSQVPRSRTVNDLAVAYFNTMNAPDTMTLVTCWAWNDAAGAMLIAAGTLNSRPHLCTACPVQVRRCQQPHTAKYFHRPLSPPRSTGVLANRSGISLHLGGHFNHVDVSP